MIPLLAILSFILFLAGLRRVLCRGWRRRAYSDYSHIHSLLNPDILTSSQLLWSRSHPNARLVGAFGLQNTFVSADITVHKHFTGRARHILREHARKFSAFRDTARDTVSGLLSRTPVQHYPSPFSEFVQAAALRIVVCSLLCGNIPEEDDIDVTFVVNTINDLWVLSKKHNTIMSPELLETLNAHLIRWLPTYERPLDFIIPTYETMWRVIAVAVAHASYNTGTRAALLEYLDSPLESQFVRFEHGRPSVDAFISEVLRLHPPSRHLARARHCYFSFAPMIEIADIKALHLDPQIWGADAHIFDSMRWHPSRVSPDQKRAHMPFGHGPLRCVALKEAPRFAAVVAAAILEAFEDPTADYQLVRGDRVGGRDGWEGWSIIKGWQVVCDSYTTGM
ncbi:cytochrome P450 [Gloeopeniophorella convolvens]|nr:cytochrome P450 [Gloeopeniophorella convolvens]